MQKHYKVPTKMVLCLFCCQWPSYQLRWFFCRSSDGCCRIV